MAFIIHCGYYYLVSNYANIGALLDVVWSFKVSSYFGLLCSPYYDINGLMQLQIIMEVSCIC
jgi:hypothetical protein